MLTWRGIKKTVRAAVIVSLLLTSTSWAGGGQPAEAAPDEAAPAGASVGTTIWATLYSGTSTRPDGGVQVRGDIHDLRVVCCDNVDIPWGFNDLAEGVAVTNATPIAVYSEVGFTGTCETFFSSGRAQKTLAGTTIGMHTISSVKVNATCLGPATSKPIVTDVQIVNSPGTSTPATCPSTYSRVAQELNEGLTLTEVNGAKLGGDHINLCVQYGPATVAAGVTKLSLVGPFDGNCDVRCADASFKTPDDACGNGNFRLKTDLNNNVNNFGAVYLCMTKDTGTDKPYLREIGAYSDNNKSLPSVGACNTVLHGAGGDELKGDANARGSGGLLLLMAVPSVKLCTTANYNTISAGTVGRTTLPTITAIAVNIPANCGMACPPPKIVKPGDTVTEDGAVHVRWECVDENGSSQSARTSNPSVIRRNSRPWNITGTCSDTWGNIATATFTFIRAVPTRQQ